MDKAVKKRDERAKHKDKSGPSTAKPPTSPDTPLGDVKLEEVEWTNEMLDPLNGISPTDSVSDLKRKREEDEGVSSPKKTRTSVEEEDVVPPPPPPPPAEDMPLDMLDATGTSLEDTTMAQVSGGDEAGSKTGYVNGLATPPVNGIQHPHPPTNGTSHPH